MSVLPAIMVAMGCEHRAVDRVREEVETQCAACRVPDMRNPARSNVTGQLLAAATLPVNPLAF